MSETSEASKITIRESTPEEPNAHPCLRGIHHWAMLTAGGTECRICGMRKR